MSQKHKLKTYPEYFSEVLMGFKKAEIRKNDRDFREGDILHLEEFEPDKKVYTGRIITALVTHILKGGNFGLANDYVSISLMVIKKTTNN